MDFKKCDRCGCFFISEDNVCCNCKTKDRADSIKLQSYLEEHSSPTSLEQISAETGITIRNLTRFRGIQEIGENINNGDFKANISIEL